jgi:hypothetical protein
MALAVPLANKGNYFHLYDFKVKPGRGDKFVELLNKFDYGDNNPFHRSSAQVKDGVLCGDAADFDHFYLIGEWADIDEHRRIRELVAREIKPEFVHPDLRRDRIDGTARGARQGGAVGSRTEKRSAFRQNQCRRRIWRDTLLLFRPTANRNKGE